MHLHATGNSFGGLSTASYGQSGVKWWLKWVKAVEQKLGSSYPLFVHTGHLQSISTAPRKNHDTKAGSTGGKASASCDLSTTVGMKLMAERRRMKARQTGDDMLTAREKEGMGKLTKLKDGKGRDGSQR